MKTPLAAFIASCDDNYRKPRIGILFYNLLDMWTSFLEITGTQPNV